MEGDPITGSAKQKCQQSSVRQKYPARLSGTEGHDDDVSSAAFSPDGSRIVTASLDKTAWIWDAATAKEIAVLRGHEGGVWSAAFSPDASRIVTASDDKTAWIWDAATDRQQQLHPCKNRKSEENFLRKAVAKC